MDIHIMDIPLDVLDDAWSLLQNYVVAIYSISPERPERLRPIGSGTLVQVSGTHYILTAAHVWHKARDAEQIGLVITDRPSSFTMHRDAICVKELWKGKESEWGPDLALLKLGLSDVSTIGARKSFLNLAQQRAVSAAHPPNTEKGLWALTGMVGQFGEVQTRPEAGTIEFHAQGRGFFSNIRQMHLHEGYDYLDASVKLNLPDVPSTFGGLSGGGLWEVRLSRTKGGKISRDGIPHFRGVAFWETEESDGRRAIRCHGPGSIFERAWESWALPLGA